MIMPYDYTTIIRQVWIDGEPQFKGTVSELPDVEVYGDTCDEVYKTLLATIEDLKELASEHGKLFPIPRKSDYY